MGTFGETLQILTSVINASAPVLHPLNARLNPSGSPNAQLGYFASCTDLLPSGLYTVETRGHRLIVYPWLTGKSEVYRRLISLWY